MLPQPKRLLQPLHPRTVRLTPTRCMHCHSHSHRASCPCQHSCAARCTTTTHITQTHAISAPRKPLSPPVTSSDHARMARVQCMHDIALMSHAGSAYASLCMVHGPAELTVHCASEHILPLGLSQNCASTSLELLLRFAHQTPPNCTVHRNCARNL